MSRKAKILRRAEKFVEQVAEIDYETPHRAFGIWGAMLFTMSSDDLIRLIRKARRINRALKKAKMVKE